MLRPVRRLVDRQRALQQLLLRRIAQSAVRVAEAREREATLSVLRPVAASSIASARSSSSFFAGSPRKPYALPRFVSVEATSVCSGPYAASLIASALS